MRAFVPRKWTAPKRVTPTWLAGQPLIFNDAAPGAHEHPSEPDPRWAKLRELKLD